MSSALLLARHGETEWNREGRLQGWEDSPLTARGYAHAHDLAAFAAALGVRHVIASTLERARSTAQIVADHVGCAIEFRDETREIDFGRCTGLTLAQAYDGFPGLELARRQDRWGQAWPGGESYEKALHRADPLLRDLRDNAMVPGPTLIIAHQSINRVLIHGLTGIEPDRVLASDQPAACVLRVDADGRVLHAFVPESGVDDARPIPTEWTVTDVEPKLSRQMIRWQPGLYSRKAAAPASR